MSRTHNFNSVGCSLPIQIVTLKQRLGPIEYRPIGEIHVCKNNLRKHPEKQIIKLMSSIRHFSFVISTPIDNDGTIITGEAGLEAARRLATCHPVTVMQNLSAIRMTAMISADSAVMRTAPAAISFTMRIFEWTSGWR